LTDSSVIAYPEAPKDEIKREQKNSPSIAEQPIKSGGAGTKNETQIFALLKIGENALKSKPSAVTVER
jgi:hypothetical protein